MATDDFVLIKILSLHSCLQFLLAASMFSNLPLPNSSTDGFQTCYAAEDKDCYAVLSWSTVVLSFTVLGEGSVSLCENHFILK